LDGAGDFEEAGGAATKLLTSARPMALCARLIFAAAAIAYPWHGAGARRRALHTVTTGGRFTQMQYLECSRGCSKVKE